ncbi:MAG: hypothetical protein ACRERD_13210 [Candidatus Binatia bacterium]
MRKTSKLWQAFLAVSIAALTVPSFAYSEGSSTESPSATGSASMSADATGAATSDEAKTAADRSLNQNIRQALSTDPTLSGSAQDIQLKTEEGEVTLEGSVINIVTQCSSDRLSTRLIEVHACSL